MTKVIKSMLDTGSGPDKIVALDATGKMPSIDGSNLTNTFVKDDLVANNLALNSFGDSVRNNTDRLALDGGWIDQFEDESDIDSVVQGSKIPMVKFDGGSSGQYFINALNSSVGMSDGKSYTISMWVKFDDSKDGVLQRLLTTNNRVSIEKASDNKIRVFLQSAAPATKADVKSTTALTASSGLTHILIGIDLANATQADRIRIYFNGTLETNVDTTAPLSDADIDFTETNITFGALNTGADPFAGDMGQMFISEEVQDLSLLANRELYIKDGNPVDMSNFGPQAQVYMNNDVANFNTNSGLGGNFATGNGEGVDAGTLTVGPSDALYDSATDSYEPTIEILDSYPKNHNGGQFAIRSTVASQSIVGVSRACTLGEVISGFAFYIDESTDGAVGNLVGVVSKTTGVLHTASISDGNFLASTAVVDASTLGTTRSVIRFDFIDPFIIDSTEDYFFGISAEDVTTQDIDVGADPSAPTSAYQTVKYTSGDAWAADLTVDLIAYFYGHKNLDLITKGSDDIGNSPLTDPTEGHIQALIEESPAGGSTVYNIAKSGADGTAWSNFTMRQPIVSSDISSSGSRVRIKLHGPTSGSPGGEGCSIDNVSFAVRSTGPHAIGTPIEVLFGGSSGVLIPEDGTVKSDWFVFDLDSSLDHLLIWDMANDSSNDHIGRNLSFGPGTYYKTSSNSYNVAAMPSGYSEDTGTRTHLIAEIEVETQQVLDTDIIAEMSRDGGTTYSPATLSRTKTQVSGTDYNLLSGEVDFTGDPSGTNIKARIRTANKDKIKVKAISPNWL